MMSKLVGVFGGTFDLVHNGHTKIIQNLLELIPFDEIKVIPNAVSYTHLTLPTTPYV